VPTKHRLIDTPPEKVPHEFAQEVIDFCKPIEAVSAAYVGLTEITQEFGYPHEQLAAGFVLETEDDEHLQQFADSFYGSMSSDVQAGGCNVLDAGGAAAWREHAHLVFSR
jgi:hypothetical protein